VFGLLGLMDAGVHQQRYRSVFGAVHTLGHCTDQHEISL
jgi:hypothetical protein